MKFAKIKIAYEDYPEQFYRTFLVKSTIDLFKLSTFCAYILRSQLCHCYLFEAEDSKYVMAPFMNDRGIKTYKYLGNYNLSSLPDKFKFSYDLGAGYDFVCEILDIVEYDSRKTFILLDAKGQGIWEDERSTLDSLLSGDIDPKRTTNDEMRAFYLPWNFDNKCFGDFFEPINVDLANKIICSEFSQIFRKIRLDEEDYINTYNISLDDLEPDYEVLAALNRIKKEHFEC